MENTKLQTCVWHGNDAYIVGGNNDEWCVLLVGGYGEEDALEAVKLVSEDSPEIEKYGDDIVFVEAVEIEEQNF